MCLWCRCAMEGGAAELDMQSGPTAEVASLTENALWQHTSGHGSLAKN